MGGSLLSVGKGPAVPAKGEGRGVPSAVKEPHLLPLYIPEYVKRVSKGVSDLVRDQASSL